MKHRVYRGVTTRTETEWCVGLAGPKFDKT